MPAYNRGSYFHLHLVSDSTGETLITVARAVTSQFNHAHAIEHLYPLIRETAQLDLIFKAIETTPGLVLFTVINEQLATRLKSKCQELAIPCMAILEPVMALFQSYLGMTHTGKVAAQHALNRDYFRRIDAMQFTMMHDDGALPDNIDEADIILIGVSRTSKTPTSIYLANRGYRTTNIPIVTGNEITSKVAKAKKPLIVGLIASPERIIQVRKTRVQAMNASNFSDAYIDRDHVKSELAMARQLCSDHNWPMIDVTQRSIEETAAEIIALKMKQKKALFSGR
jgi:[pyruvate, water dikinase]-phosphate phosphotransferase / [pyruvate, water dikinase] kinase